MKLNKTEKEKVAYIWKGIKTGQAISHHYKVEMIKFYNEKNNKRYKYTTNCSSCLNTIYKYFEMLVETKPKKTKKNGRKK
tara:strand:- start:47 stop:286 length:240 start_codon:yes stop_codon:yes gene_type:complete